MHVERSQNLWDHTVAEVKTSDRQFLGEVGIQTTIKILERSYLDTIETELH
jgi:hypothetical protein